MNKKYARELLQDTADETKRELKPILRRIWKVLDQVAAAGLMDKDEELDLQEDIHNIADELSFTLIDLIDNIK